MNPIYDFRDRVALVTAATPASDLINEHSPPSGLVVDGSVLSLGINGER